MNNSTPDHDKFDWQDIVQDALVEVNPEQLRAKVAEAEEAIFKRLQVLDKTPENEKERHALQDAANTLLILKREVLKFPDWGSDHSSTLK